MRCFLLISLLLSAPAATAQTASGTAKDEHPQHRRADSVVHQPADGTTPTGLTPADVTGLREGRGMGLAKAAELHHYPGPMHVLEHADALALTAGQRAEAERLMRDVKTSARTLGERIIAAEHALDALFVEERATPDRVDEATATLGRLRGELRAAHLRAHVAMRAALTPEQVETYDRLRGHTD